MPVIQKKFSRSLLLFGDVCSLALSLFLALLIRYQELPGSETLSTHFSAFVWLFGVWVLAYFIAGLYSRQTLIFSRSLPQLILRTQLFNAIIAVLFFYTIPYFSITPKTNLFIYLVVSSLLIALWRHFSTRWLADGKRLEAVLVAGGRAGKDIEKKVKQKSRFGLQFIDRIDPGTNNDEEIFRRVSRAVESGASFIILDTRHSATEAVLPKLYNLLYRDVHFIEFDVLYEEVFQRVPVSMLQHQWFISHIKQTPHAAYDFLKRVFDVVVSTLLLVLSAPIVGVVALAIKFEDDGNIFFWQERVGQGGEIISVVKLRSMEVGEANQTVTQVGWWLRKTRIDELPQLWSVLVGDLSLIGPRPEIPRLAKAYYEKIPFYNARHFIKPGMSGWAQLKHDNPPKFATDVKKTKEKLAYDFYYIKHRSFWLDLKIALWTLRVLASQSGK